MLLGEDLVKKLSDPNRFEIFEEVPILYEHEIKDEEGRKIADADGELLSKIANNNNKKIEETGDACPVVIGHTSDKNRLGEQPDEQDQPEIVGYATNFVVGKMPKTGKKAIFARFHIYKDRADDVERYYPRRSVELWTHGHWEIDPISLLGATAPEQSLGLMIRHRRGGRAAIKYHREDRYRYNESSNRVEKMKPLQLENDFGTLKGLKKKMARDLHLEDAYSTDHDDLTDFDPKMVNTMLKILEKSPMWKFYKDQEKKAKEEEEMADQQAMMPPDAAQGQPNPMGAAPPADPNATQPPVTGDPSMQGQPNAPLTAEEMAELNQLLNTPSVSSVGNQPWGQGGPPIPQPQAPGPQRKARSTSGCEDTSKKVIATAVPQGIETESEDKEEMGRKGGKKKMSSHTATKKKPSKYAADEEDEQLEDDSDYNGTQDDEWADSNSTVPEVDGGDEANNDSDDTDEDSDDEHMEEWEDETPEGEEEGMEEDDEEMPMKKQASFAGPTNSFVPGNAQKRPSEAGSTRNPKRQAEMKVKTKMNMSRKKNPPRSISPGEALAKLTYLEKMVEKLTAENEAMRVQERYARRENQIARLINEGYEVDNPKELFEDFKDDSDEVFEKQLKSIRKYARQSQDISRVKFFEAQSPLQETPDIDERDGAPIGMIMAREGCDFETAKKIYFQNKRRR